MADIPLIKAEPLDAPSPAFSDDIYEDAGDLEFYADPAMEKVYLARVPAYVWEAWSKLDDDAEIQIGTVRVHGDAPPQGVCTFAQKKQPYLTSRSIQINVPCPCCYPPILHNIKQFQKSTT